MSTICERMCEPPKVGDAQLLMVDNEPAVRSEGPETIQYLDPPQGLSTISGGGSAAPADEPLYVHVSALGVLSKFSYPMGLPRQIVSHKVTLTAAVELFRAYTWRFKDYGIPNEPPLFLW